LKETDIILQYGVTVKGKSLKEHEEVKGQEYALNFLKEVIKTNESLSLRLIREFHALVLNDDIENRGKFKKSNNEILGAGFETTPYYLVEEKLTELIEKFNSSENNDLIMKVACFHADFEKIHPFIDGNGRTGRLLLNLELMKNGYPITVIRNEDRDEYYTALETAQVESNYELLAGFIEKSAENTFWMYYKYFDEDTKMKFEEYLKKNGINPKEVYQKRFEDYPETGRDFPRGWDK
jgi:filamentation induced by cAMP protein fic